MSKKTEEFDEWLENLRDVRALAKILARVQHLELGNPGDVKAVGEGISEMRIDYGPGYRGKSPRRCFCCCVGERSQLRTETSGEPRNLRPDCDGELEDGKDLKI